MADSVPVKNLLHAIHDAAQFLLHVILIPVVGVLKAVNSLTTHLIAELSKV